MTAAGSAEPGPRDSGFRDGGLDQRAWDAICRWPNLSGESVFLDGADYGELTRWFLWDKVARALRRQADPGGFALEARLIAQAEPAAAVSAKGLRRFLSGLRASLHGGRRWPPAATSTADSPVVFVPVLSPHLAGALRRTLERGQLRICAGMSCVASIAGLPISVRPNLVRPQRDTTTAKRLGRAILLGLGRLGIDLLPRDVRTLHGQLEDLVASVHRAREELSEARPAAVLLHADNHPPFQPYVLEARRQGIPTLMLQHGLDCEHYCLEEAYASHVAVWGSARCARYEKASRFRPELRVTGNPAYDSVQLGAGSDSKTADWLWLTRPNSPWKCYSPSRSPGEGLAIFRTLLEGLAGTPETRLLVKAHPLDCVSLYRDELQGRDIAGRVQFCDGPLEPLADSAAVVVSQDSTAGMEAMFRDKPLVHAHFAACPPSVPFLEYGAALPGRNPEELLESLGRAACLRGEERSRLRAGQRAFLDDFAGSLDGRSGDRFADFTWDVIARGSMPPTNQPIGESPA